MPKKILIIEDDKDILEIMSFILFNEGYEIILASDSAPLNEIQVHLPDLILMDNQITDGYGHDFCRKFKNDPATSHFRVVLMSANTNLEKLASESQADGYLQKPFDVRDLLSMVKRLA